jgi:putative ABC transport system permease protein
MSWLNRTADDLRHALRRLRARPAAVALAVGMLGLGIALTTAMSAIVDALVIRRIPFEAPEQLAQLEARTGRTGRVGFAWPVLRAWRSTPGFESVEGVASTGDVTIETPAGPLVQASATVTPGIFGMLRVAPLRGRLFSPGDGRDGTDNRIVLSEELWPMVSGGRTFAPGTTITIGGQTMYVLGLMPAAFRFPAWNTKVWRVVDADAPPVALANAYSHVYVRFAPNAPRAGVLALAARNAEGLDDKIPSMETVREWSIVGSGPDEFFGRAIPAVSTAIALVFLVLCANVASLLLAQFTTRRHEFGMCSALGASRGRLMREALFEGAVLAGAAVAAGVVLASMLTSLARGYLPEALVQASLNTVELDGRALVVAVIAGACAMILAALLPAWIGTRVDPAEAIRGSGRATTESRAARVTTRGLLITEIALTCVLLTGATQLVRSFVNIASASRGLDVDGVVTTWVHLDKTYATEAARRVAATVVEATARAIPGANDFDMSFGVPPGGGSTHFGDDWLSDVPGAHRIDLTAESYDVSPGFFELYRIPLLRGRTFAPGAAANEVIVGERFAGIMWPGLDPVGRSFRFDGDRYDVIGVAREIAMPSLDAARKDLPEFYSRFRGGRDYFAVSVRCASVCSPAHEIANRFAAAGPGISARSDVPDRLYRLELARPRSAALLGGLIAIVAVLTAAGGLFSVLSFGVNQRRRALSIRAALGASATQIRRLVLLEGARTTAIGLAIGGSAAWVLSRGLGSLQYEVSRNDPQTWLAVFTLIGATTIAACWLPARRAGEVDVAGMMRDG